MNGQNEEYEWFTVWVDQHLGVCITVASGSDVGRTLEAFGVEPAKAEELSLSMADERVDQAVVRVGTANNCSYAIEHFTGYGLSDSALRALSTPAGLTVALGLGHGVDVLHIWRDGVPVVAAIDLAYPDDQNSVRESEYADAASASGILTDGLGRRAGGAKFIELVTGLVITPEILEGAALGGLIDIARRQCGAGDAGEVRPDDESRRPRR